MEETPRYDTGASMEMPRYVSCKLVHALKIADIEHVAGQPTVRLHFEDPRYAPRTMGSSWVDKRGAQAGGYFIVYEDGYISWSPADVFERGNTPEHEWGIPVTQERKYGVNLRGKLFNRATGAEVACPVFMVLAKDNRGLPTVLNYRASVPGTDTDTWGALNRVLQDFDRFRLRSPEAMKDGDTKAAYSEQPTRWAPGERET